MAAGANGYAVYASEIRIASAPLCPFARGPRPGQFAFYFPQPVVQAVVFFLFKRPHAQVKVDLLLQFVYPRLKIRILRYQRDARRVS